jgi:hypothetical protein
VLQDLQDVLDRHQELEPNKDGLSGIPRRVWKRLKWDMTEITEFRQRITGYVDTLNLFLTGLTTYVSNDNCHTRDADDE